MMEHKISMALIDDDGSFIAINTKDRTIEFELETKIADVFSEINRSLNKDLLDDSERRIAEKFRFCQSLEKFLEDYENVDKS